MRRVLVLAAALAGCSGGIFGGDDWSRRVGVLYPELSSVQMLEVPSQVRAGVAFDVVVRTVGSSSCTRAAGMVVKVDGLVVDLTPYDEYAPRDRACTDDLHAFEHRTRVTLPVAGEATVRVHGRAPPGSTQTYEAGVQVLP